MVKPASIVAEQKKKNIENYFFTVFQKYYSSTEVAQ